MRKLYATIAAETAAAAVAAACALGAVALTPLNASAAPQDDPIVPHPAQKMPLADQSIMVDMAQAGSRVVAVGERGIILYSDDGQNWTQADVPVSVMLNRVQFVSPRVGWAAGHDATILKTTDAGVSWELQHYKVQIDGLEKAVYDLHFFDENNGLAVGAYNLLMRTRDGGQTWEQDPAATFGELHRYSITELADGTLVITGEGNDIEGSMLERSTDQGRSWQRIESPYFGSLFGAVPVGRTGAIIFGLRGNAHLVPNIAAVPSIEPNEYDEFEFRQISDDASIELETPTTNSLFNGVSLGRNGALMGGVNGTLLKFTPGESVLKPVSTGSTAIVGDIQPMGSELIVAGETGVTTIPLPR